MKRNLQHTIIGCCCLALFVCACGGQAREAALDLIVSTQGGVLLMRDGWTASIPVAAGTQLGPTDTLEIRPSGQATVVCSASTTRVIRESQRNPCAQIEGGKDAKDGATYSPTQRQPPSDIPYPIHPQSTTVLEQQPLLVWHDTGAHAYTVSVVSSDDNAAIWSTSGITTTQVRYPADARYALVPGISYRVVVVDETTGRSSADNPTPGGGFTLLEEGQRRIINQQLTSLRQHTDLDDPSKSLAEAVLLMSTRESGPPIAGEAWLRLDAVALQVDTPAAYLRLGDALLTMQLPAEAAGAFQSAIDRATALGDLETAAEGLIGRAKTLRQAADCATAIDLFRKLGDPRAETVPERCP